MKQIRKRLTYANVMSSIAVFLVLGGATAVAAGQLGKNSVGTKQLKKNAVTTAKLKSSSVTAAKIKNNAVTSDKIASGAITGAKVNLGSLGTVPTATDATNATNATNLAGQKNFFIRLNGGQTETIVSNGAVSLLATCEVNVGGNDFVRIVAETSTSGAVLAAEKDLPGPGGTPAEFLEPGTPVAKREFVFQSDTTGDINVRHEIDAGFVLGPEGKMISANSEGIVLGLNYGSPCLVAGVVNLIG